ncbi:hypothetical protein OAS54_02165 [Gammaproteobacteria bacterium]|nr:hypothetical protein [Gammaproteobacteria bacterium]MDC0902185.1 hypothetical protein [Gammaproteobacteria bacterium]
MSKNLLLILPLLLVGCAVSTPLLVDFRTPDTKYGNWNYIKSSDDFDGDYYVSFIRSSDNNAYVRVITRLNDSENRFEYSNGDSYICVLYSSLNTEMIFYKDDKEQFRQEVPLRISTDNTVLVIGLGGGENQLNQLLNRYDQLKIRTTDSCGTVTTNTFNIKGTTHLRPMES